MKRKASVLEDPSSHHHHHHHHHNHHYDWPSFDYSSSSTSTSADTSATSVSPESTKFQTDHDHDHDFDRTHPFWPAGTVPYLNSRTRKRYRDGRPDTDTIHQTTLAKLFDAQRQIRVEEQQLQLQLQQQQQQQQQQQEQQQYQEDGGSCCWHDVAESPAISPLTKVVGVESNMLRSEMWEGGLDRNQRSIHSFFGGGGGGSTRAQVPVQASRTQAVAFPFPFPLSGSTGQSVGPLVAEVARCEDCGTGLRSTSMGAEDKFMSEDTDVLGVDRDLLCDDDVWACDSCRRRVCDMCAVRGDYRICLECAVPGGG